jgi:signal transduction histidine kinase
VSCLEQNNAVRFTIEDDGCGIDSAKLQPYSGGLMLMRERAKALGGTFRIDNGLEGGTCVSISLPVPSRVRRLAGNGQLLAS